jgi:hypothetical protein
LGIAGNDNSIPKNISDSP